MSQDRVAMPVDISPSWMQPGMMRRAYSMPARVLELWDPSFPVITHRGDFQAYALGEPDGSMREANPGTPDLNYGPPPMRIPRLFKMGISAWAGEQQWGAVQADHRRYFPVVRWAFPTRGARSISGVVARGTYAAQNYTRVPAVFVPSSTG